MTGARARTTRSRPPAPTLPGRFRLLPILGVLLLLLVIIGISTAGYMIIESPRYGFIDALYMTVITISTVGMGEVHPLSPHGRVWTIFVIVGGAVTAATFLSMLVGLVVEGQVRRILGRRQLEHKIKGLTDHVILCGYGRIGAMVAAELHQAGRRVVAVEIDQEQTAVLEASGILYVLGDAQDEETLAAAGLANAAVLVAALPTDAQNVLVTLTARQSNPDILIISRATEVASQNKMKQAGASRVVCPHIMGASRIVDIVLRPAVVDFFEVASKGVDLEMDQIVLSTDSDLVGKSLKELELPRRAGVHVAAICRGDGETIYRPSSNVTLEAGDTVILFGKTGSAAALKELRL